MGSRKKKDKGKKKKPGRQAKAPHTPLAPFGDVAIIRDPLGQVKMSEVLTEFIEPYSHTWRNEDELRKLLSIALVAWNASLVPPAEGEQLLRETTKTIPPDARRDYLSIVAEMMQRKLTHFAGNTRFIIDYHLTMRPSGPYLEVMSTFEKP